MKIIVPAMYPFPLIVFEDDKETLATIAELLMVIHANGSTKGLCLQMRELDESANGLPSIPFNTTMSNALGGCGFATIWAEQHHGLNWVESASFRPAWAAHIAEHINKGLNK